MSTLSQRRTTGSSGPTKPYKCRKCGGIQYKTEKDGHRRCMSCWPKWKTKYLIPYLKDYRERNKEELKKKRNAKYKSNRAKYLGQVAAYQADNPHVKKEHARRRREKIRVGGLTRKDLETIVERDGGRCVYCRVSVKTNCTPSRVRGFDHLVPLLSDEGEHATWNLAVCCIECNSAKCQTHFVDYIVRAEIDGEHLERIPQRAWGLR